MALKAFPTVKGFVRKRLRASKPDPLRLEVESKLADFSEPARIVLWHLADRALPPGTFHEVIREARLKTNPDHLSNELSASGLVDHDFAGNRFIRPEVLPILRDLLGKD